MKKLILITVFVTLAASVYAQEAVDVTKNIQTATTAAPKEEQKPEESNWSKRGIAGVNMAQSSFSNWVAGGDASIAFDALLTYDLNYSGHNSLWNNRLELAYGLNNTQTNGRRKTNDRIFLSSTYGYGIAKNLYLGAMLTFNTQFDRGYNYSDLSDRGETPGKTNYISKFMAPGYLTVGAGLIWTPKTWLTVTYNPASWRGTFVFDDTLPEGSRYGVAVGQTLFSQFGSNLVAEFNKEICKNIMLFSRLDLYLNYATPEYVIMRWDNMLNMKINKWLSANLSVNLIYDHNALTALQVKQILGIGFQMAF